MIPKQMKSLGGHEWVASTVGHGEYQCRHCLITNREAWAIGTLDATCSAALTDLAEADAQTEKEVSDDLAPY